VLVAEVVLISGRITATASSSFVYPTFVAPGYKLCGNKGTLATATGASASGSKSGKKAKSIVLESPTDFKLLEVLNWRVEGADAGAASLAEAASSIAACTFVKEGFWVVRKGEDSTCAVMRRERDCGLEREVEVSLVRVRNDVAREVAIANVLIAGLSEEILE